MFDVLPHQIPWYLAGPALGLLIVGLFVLANQPLGASGAYVQTAALLRRREPLAMWRVWYFVGLFLGGIVVTQVLRAGSEFRSGYDAMREVFSIGVTVPLVFLGATPHDRKLSTAAPNHSNRVFFDESAMTTGIALYAATALRKSNMFASLR